ncbi:MAG: hypothetical protein GF416_03610 [Candidatus Altiarchaeales archaeon]|nr:hypothetical protein [Candidatus Altiarchaeales archaeon]MBD3416206.1 hypothetical protein [Candidatus Altiarchaeales archaeon]
MRWFHSAVALLLLATGGCGQEWNMFQGDIRHSGYYNADSDLVWDDVVQLWAYDVPGRIYYTPLITDMDDDGLLEVVVATLEGDVYLFGADGGMLWRYGLGSPVGSHCAIGQDNGEKFVASLTSSGMLVLIGSDGMPLFMENLDIKLAQMPISTGDLNGDGKSEFILGSLVLTVDGTQLEYDSDHLFEMGYALGYQMLSDLDGDGGYEAYDGGHFSMPASADVNGDGVAELIRYEMEISGKRRYLAVYNNEREVIWLRNVTGLRSSLLVGDPDGDGETDVIFCDDIGSLQIMSLGLADEVHIFEGLDCVYAIPTDLNGDGHAEFLVASSDGRVSLLGSDKDSDGDGLMDFFEDVKGLDKHSRDSDGDGIEDIRDPKPLEPHVMVDADEIGRKSTVEVLSELVFTPLSLFLIVVVCLALLYRFTSYNLLEYRIRKPLVRDLKGVKSKMFPKRVKASERRAMDTRFISKYSPVEFSLARQLSKILAEGDISLDYSSAALKISKEEVLKIVEKMEKDGYLTVDSSNANNPVFRATDKLRGL